VSTAPPIQYSGLAISAEVPWDVRVHLQALYKVAGNHVQAMSLLTGQIAALKNASSSTTSAPAPSGGSSVPISLGGVNDQSGSTTYTTTVGDDGVVLLLNDASAVAVTLDSSAPPDFYLYVTNFGAGLVTLTPSAGTINGAASFTVPTDGLSLVLWNGTAWYASAVSAPTGLSVTITTAALTSLGSQGSQTFTNGILTAQTQAT
jgi:hypothetical protein